MRKCIFYFVYLFTTIVNSQPNYNKTWATYFGDENVKIIDSEMDGLGNLYFVGQVLKGGWPLFQIATVGAHQYSFGGGNVDGFIAKFNPDGELLWATYFGGEDDDTIEDIAVDKFNNLYCIGGTKSAQNIATPNSFQPELKGESDIFITKLNPEGTVIWSTYYGGDFQDGMAGFDINAYNLDKTIIVDDLNHLYVTFPTNSPGLATPGVFQESREDAKYMIAKFRDTGNLIWATYYGKQDSTIKALDIGATGIFITGNARDNCPPFFIVHSYFATPNCHQYEIGNCSDSFITKFNFEGQRIWSTYYGGMAQEFQFNNNVKCADGFVYFAGATSSSNNISTPNSFQPLKASINATMYLVKFDEEGNRIWGTYLGENLHIEGNNEVSIAKLRIRENAIWIYGSTQFPDNIGTENTLQPIRNGSSIDGFFVKFTTDGQREWGSYFGGDLADRISNVLVNNETIYVLGRSESTSGITTPDTYQSDFLNNNNPWFLLNIENTFLARLDPNPLSVEEFDSNGIFVFPNPNGGEFSIQSNSSKIETIQIFDILGKQIKQQNYFENTIQISGLSKGFYVVKITLNNQKVITKKIIVK